MNDCLNLSDNLGATVLRGSTAADNLDLRGVFYARCLGPDGAVKWEDTFTNTVMTEGKNVALDAALAGSAYTVTGPFMGLISSVSYVSVPVAADTMASHATWVEAGSASNFPLYTTPRKTCVWSAASAGSKALSAALSFPIITTGGTVKGAFITFGTGAVSTIADTNGKLWCAGLFSGGDKVVGVGDTLQITYTINS
tara:strand:- start:910 stop:1500 length:591 start_codon:yes stop_codon:yes gene_type:complete